MVGGVLETAPGITVPHLAGLPLPCICAAGSKGIIAGAGKALQGCLKEEPSGPITFVSHIQHGIEMLGAVTQGHKSHPHQQVQVVKVFWQGRGCISQVYRLDDLSK